MQVRMRRLAVLLVVLSVMLAACGGGGGSAGGGSGSGEQGASGGADQAKARVAMILPGTVEDADYNFVGYQALQSLKEELGVDVAYQERVAPADAERVARGFINDGYNIIAFHGGQFVTTVQKLAPQFPDVNFIMESGGPMSGLPGNVWNIGRRFYEGFYGLGALGAVATKSDKIGIVLGVQLPDFVASVNAIRQAVQEHNPDAEVVYTFVGDQNDPVKARQAAEAQINEGVDFIILVVNLGAQGVIEAVKGKPVLLTTYYTDKTELAPENFTASLLTDFATPYKNVVEKILQGQRGGYEEMRPGNGMDLSEIRNVSDDVAAQVRDIFAKVAAKEIQIPEVLELPK
ncbi:MAG TPA: BMP family protein [Thermaerobacter sp.]